MAIVTSIFADKGSAERAFQAALNLGYAAGDITVVMSKETRERSFAAPLGPASTELEAKAAEKDQSTGDKLGGPVGGTIGTLTPVVAAVSAAALVPGIGIVAGRWPRRWWLQGRWGLPAVCWAFSPTGVCRKRASKNMRRPYKRAGFCWASRQRQPRMRRRSNGSGGSPAGDICILDQPAPQAMMLTHRGEPPPRR